MTKKKKSILSDQRFIVLLVIIVLFAIFSFKSREFRQYTTILSMLDFSYYDLLMAIGVTFPLITGGVDLSIGTGMVCYALIAGSLVRNNNLPVVLAMLLCIVLGIIVNGLAGYALAKVNFPFREQWLLVIMMLLIVPTETVITIHFLIIAKAGLLNTVIGYILPMIVNPFNIFLFRQVFVSLPDDVYEAAQLDFCGPVKYFFTMVLPMSKTVVATVSVFTFLGVWNDYLWPSLVFTSSDLLTAQIGLNSITSNDNTTMGQVLAVITLITIPVMIIYALFSKQIVEGVTSTGSKEG